MFGDSDKSLQLADENIDERSILPHDIGPYPVVAKKYFKKQREYGQLDAYK